ncbi:endonuclease domain-containing protein [Roseitalea porphyridii]|uniref:Endonuclease domain-containing protein n=1 Tax=Roseitalea porphyridii TaxID=1852022 RepID=A0A4P6UYY8_9HYPH|nr:endonuclease domain-containing protein [Roseitalea porphyridii]QBK30242.1 endonuclease domain-containing protein [Roseitalea porphyridii]
MVEKAQRDHARMLRHQATVAERLLWDELRRFRKQGYPFRRQVPIGPYIADFASHRLRLVVEVDGDRHETSAGRRHDVRRDSFLRSIGYAVMRFDEPDVRANPWAVAEEIRAAIGDLSRRTPTRPGAAAPVHPPRKGEGNA